MKLGKVWIFIALVYVVTSLKCENVNNKKNGNNVERNSEIDNMNREQILENNINEAHRKIKECENQKNELAIQIKNVQNSLYKNSIIK